MPHTEPPTLSSFLAVSSSSCSTLYSPSLVRLVPSHCLRCSRYTSLCRPRRRRRLGRVETQLRGEAVTVGYTHRGVKEGGETTTRHFEVNCNTRKMTYSQGTTHTPRIRPCVNNN